MKTSYSSAAGQKNFPEVVAASEKGEPIPIERHGETVAYVISKDRFDAVLDTMELLSDQELVDTLPLERGAWQADYKRAKADVDALDPKKHEPKALMEVAPLAAQEATSPDPRTQRQLDEWKDGLARDLWVDETTRILADMKKAP